jgi:hypothetical protein
MNFGLSCSVGYSLPELDSDSKFGDQWQACSYGLMFLIVIFVGNCVMIVSRVLFLHAFQFCESGRFD